MMHNAVDAAMMLAAMQHFSLCDKARDATWSEPEIFISGNPYHFDFVKAALDHAVTCTDAQPLNIRTNPFANSQEPVMAETAQEPEPQPIRVPALDLSCTDHVEGVILTVDHDGETHHYDLVQVVEQVPHMQFLRYDTVRLTTVVPVDPTEWDLAAGTELTLYAITGNGQFLVIGDYAYDYNTVKGFLRTHGSKLELSSSDYTPPLWAIQQAASLAASPTQAELDAEGGQLLPDRTHGVDTGLTELPADASEDPEHYDHEIDPDAYSQDDMYTNGGIDWLWFTKPQTWFLTLLGFATGILTVATITINANHHFNLFWSVLIGLVVGINATCAAGIISCLIVGKYAEKPQFVTEEYEGQQILWTLGGVLGWGVLCLVDLAFLF